MTSIPFVDAATLARVLPMTDAIDVLESTFGSDPEPHAPPRSHLTIEGGDLLLMPAWSHEGTGVKLVTVAPGNPQRGLPLIQGLYVLFSAKDLSPVALFEGAGLTRIRTAAVSGVATRRLAREDAARLVVFGAGVQAEAHIEAMRAVRPVMRVDIVSRSRWKADDLAARTGAVVSEAAVVAEADIVCTCTTSRDPVFDGHLLRAGTHVNAVGAYTPQTRELDDVAVSSGRVVVETKEAALAEAGDVIDPVGSGTIDPGDIDELREVVRGKGRISPDEVTIFKSVGIAFEDLAVAAAAYARLRETTPEAQ